MESIFSGFSAKRATMVFMEYSTGKILHMEVGDNMEADKKSAAMEGLLLKRGIDRMEEYGLRIKEVVTDASSTFITFFGKHVLNSVVMQQVIYATGSGIWFCYYPNSFSGSDLHCSMIHIYCIII